VLPTNNELKQRDPSKQILRMCQMCGATEQFGNGWGTDGVHRIDTNEQGYLCHDCNEMMIRFPDVFRWVEKVLINHIKLMHELP